MRVTGFSEITPERAAYAGEDPWFVEIALTGKCNFKCEFNQGSYEGKEGEAGE